MFKILLFDDMPQVRFRVDEMLRAHDIDVYVCRSVFEADDYWENHEHEIDAIVIDLMMPSRGLNSNLRNLTQGCLFTGWIWLWNHININDISPHPATCKKIVIYSAYVDDFNQYIINEKSSDAEKQFASSIYRIKKNADGEQSLLDLLEEWLREQSLDKKSFFDCISK